MWNSLTFGLLTNWTVLYRPFWTFNISFAFIQPTRIWMKLEVSWVTLKLFIWFVNFHEIHLSCAVPRCCFLIFSFHLSDLRYCIRNPGMIAIRTIVAVLPAWFRCSQCLRRYHDTKDTVHVYNACKYFSSVFVVIFSSITFATTGKIRFEIDESVRKLFGITNDGKWTTFLTY